MSPENFVVVMLWIVALKALIIGSDFNFHYLYKYGKDYWKWYDNRESYKEFLKKRERKNERSTNKNEKPQGQSSQEYY